MRVLHVLEAVGGGTMRHLEDLVSEMLVEQHVACPIERSTDLSHPDPAGALRAAGATVHTVAMSRKVHDRQNITAVRRLRKLIKALEPDVVHAHASVAGALARVAAFGLAPVVWAPHAVHNRRWALLVERRLRRLADVVVTLSPSEASAALEAGLASDQQLRIIHNGVASANSSAVAHARSELGIPADALVMGFIGRFADQKAPLDFVEAARAVLASRIDAHALCIGSGPMEAEVLAAASTLPPGRFHHVVCDAGAERLLGAVDVLVTPSLYEGGPYLPLEAMQAGVPVVASNCSGLRDYVVHNVSGLSVDVGDVAGYAAAVLALLEDTEMRASLIDSARDYVRLYHDRGEMARAYEDLYLELAPAASLPQVPQLQDVDVYLPRQQQAPSRVG